MALWTQYVHFIANNSWLWILTLVITLYWLYMRKWIVIYIPGVLRSDGKTFIITGAESGLGMATACILAARGGKVIMACKDTKLGKTAKDEIISLTRNENIEVRHLDLTSLESVRKFSADIHQSEDRVDVLINNASIHYAPVSTTSDGLNTVMQNNHFGPFLLTNLLLDLLKKSSPSRIIFLTSILHHFHKFNLDNINCDKEELPTCRVFFNSQLANILMARYFGRMLLGTGVTVNTVYPGTIQPDPTTDNCSSSVIWKVYNIWRCIFGKSFSEGAVPTVSTSTCSFLTDVTGQHFVESKPSGCVASITNDHVLQENLFEKSSQLVKLGKEERYL